jgi:hypothetical protein
LLILTLIGAAVTLVIGVLLFFGQRPSSKAVG